MRRNLGVYRRTHNNVHMWNTTVNSLIINAHMIARYFSGIFFLEVCRWWLKIAKPRSAQRNDCMRSRRFGAHICKCERAFYIDLEMVIIQILHVWFGCANHDEEALANNIVCIDSTYTGPQSVAPRLCCALACVYFVRLRGKNACVCAHAL